MAGNRDEDRHPVVRVLAIAGTAVGTLTLLAGILENDWGSTLFGAGALTEGLLIWIAGVQRVQCRFVGFTTGRPCIRTAGGVLRGCEQSHKGLKMAALLERLGLPHWHRWNYKNDDQVPLAGRLLTFRPMMAVIIMLIVSAAAIVVGGSAIEPLEPPAPPE